MCRKLSIILLLYVVVFAPSIASAQGDIWSKQKIAIEEIVDKTERGLDKDYKSTIYANLRNILANNNYNAFEVNRNDVINQLKTKNQDITLPNIYKEIGEMGADFIIRTEIRATSSAYDAQNANAKIIIVLSQHRIATGKEVSRTEMVDPYKNEITNAIIRLTSQLFGIPISEASRQTSSSYQPSSSYGSQSNYGSSNSSLYQRPSYQQQSSSYQSQSNYGSSNSSSYSRSSRDYTKQPNVLVWEVWNNNEIDLSSEAKQAIHHDVEVALSESRNYKAYTTADFKMIKSCLYQSTYSAIAQRVHYLYSNVDYIIFPKVTLASNSSYQVTLTLELFNIKTLQSEGVSYANMSPNVNSIQSTCAKVLNSLLVAHISDNK